MKAPTLCTANVVHIPGQSFKWAHMSLTTRHTSADCWSELALWPPMQHAPVRQAALPQQRATCLKRPSHACKQKALRGQEALHIFCPPQESWISEVSPSQEGPKCGQFFKCNTSHRQGTIHMRAPSRSRNHDTLFKIQGLHACSPGNVSSLPAPKRMLCTPSSASCHGTSLSNTSGQATHGVK